MYVYKIKYMCVSFYLKSILIYFDKKKFLVYDHINMNNIIYELWICILLALVDKL